MAIDSTAPPIVSPNELVAFANCELVRISDTAVLVINRDNGRQQMMSPQVVQGLISCSTFRTMADHASVLAATRPELQGRPELALQALEGLLVNGMLLTAADAAARLSGGASVAPAATRVFIITCDRPAAVERLLESLLRNGKLARHEGLYLIDDSRLAESRVANRELVAGFNTRSPVDMRYVGEAAQSAMLEGLIARQPAAEHGLRFLLDPAQWTGHKTYGRSRTLCLLFSVGYRAIVMDDDVLCQALLPPVAEEGLAIAGGASRQAAFFADREELARAAVPADFDPLSGHASLLGRTVGAVVEAVSPGGMAAQQLQGVNASLASVLDAGAPILVTQSGSWGDPGTASPHWVVSLGDTSVVRLLEQEASLVDIVEKRCNWLGSPRLSLIKMASMSQMTGLDNSALLPPYFPAFRGEDRLFGAMVEAIHHRAAALEYPWCVPHLPMEERHLSIREPMAATGGIALFARYLTDHIDYKDASDPLLRLRHVAEDARRIAARSDRDLLLDFRTEVAQSQAGQLRMILDQQQKAVRLGSGAWQAYLQRALNEMQALIAEQQSPTTMHGVPAGSSELGLLQCFRDYANGFADALEHWAVVREASVAVAAQLELEGKLVA
ncbi:MAG: hypothetical protein NWQ24_01750 [Haliea sp.]|jgi:hypothetical protein|nr:hypothetical protein [Haliea sp.]